MLTTIERWAIIAKLVDRMRSDGGWSGETHIQKAVCFLNSLLKVPASYNFLLYKHGPYSFDLHDDLGKMKANRILDIEPQRPYGPSFGLGALGAESIRRGEKAVRKFESQISFVCDSLGGNDVRTLERYATALYVKLKNPGLASTELAGIVTELKPHIDQDSAREAVESVTKLIDDATLKGLIID